MEGTPSKLNPALIGGAMMGVLSSVPLIREGNCLCCLWILAGGVVAAYLYWREFPSGMSFSLSEGATVGLIAGLYGGLFATLLGLFIEIMGLDPTRALFQSMMEFQKNFSTGLEDLFKSFENSSVMEPFYVLGTLIFNVLRSMIFGTLGGVIGGAMIGKRQKKGNLPTAT